MTTTGIPTLDQAKLEAFVGQAVVDMGAAISGLMLHLGDRLGLYKAMAGAGPLTSVSLAQRTGTAERYVREWLANQAAGGYVAYDPYDNTFELPAEQAMVVADEQSPVFLGGAFETIASCYADHDMFVDAFRSGDGIGWHAHDERLFSGCLRLFRPGYAAHLVQEWLPALDGVVDKLRAGANVADVGCGYGASTILMAEAFAHSRFVGFDSHRPSVQAARAAAVEAGVQSRRTFRCLRGQGIARHRLRLGLPVRHPARHGRSDRRRPNHPEGPGTRRHADAGRAASWRCPRAEPEPRRTHLLRPVRGHLHPGLTGPGSRPRARGTGRRTPARGVLREAGFSSVRRVAETPFNMILEAKP